MKKRDLRLMKEEMDFTHLLDIIINKMPRSVKSIEKIYLDFIGESVRIFYTDTTNIDCIHEIKISAFLKR